MMDGWTVEFSHFYFSGSDVPARKLLRLLCACTCSGGYQFVFKGGGGVMRVLACKDHFCGRGDYLLSREAIHL